MNAESGMMLLFVLSKETKYNMEYIYGGENVFDQALIVVLLQYVDGILLLKKP